MRTRQDRVNDLAWAIYQSIRSTQPKVTCFTHPPERGHDIEGTVVFEGLDDVGLDGNFDLLKLADDLFGRIS